MPRARTWALMLLALLVVPLALPLGPAAEQGLPDSIPSPSWYAAITGEQLRTVQIAGDYVVTFSLNMTTSVIRVYNASTGEQVARIAAGVSMFAEPYPLILPSEYDGKYYIAYFNANETAVVLELPGLNTVLRAGPPEGFSHVYAYGLLQLSPDTLLAVYKASNATQSYTLLAVAGTEGIRYDAVKGEPLAWCADTARERVLAAVKTGGGDNTTTLSIYALTANGSQVLANSTYGWKPRRWSGNYLAAFNPECSMLALAAEAGGTYKIVLIGLEGDAWAMNLSLIPVETLRWSPLGTYIVVGAAASESAISPEKVLFIPPEKLTSGAGEIYTYEPPSPAVIDDVELYTVKPPSGEGMDVAFVKLTHTPYMGDAEIVVPETGDRARLHFAYAAAALPDTDKLVVAVKEPVQPWPTLEVYAIGEEGIQHLESYSTFLPGLPKSITPVPGAGGLVLATYSGTSLSTMTNVISRLDWHNATRLLETEERAVLAVPYLKGYSWSYQGSLNEADGYEASATYRVEVSQAVAYLYYRAGQNWSLARSVPGIVARVSINLESYNNVEAVKIAIMNTAGGQAVAYNHTGAQLSYSADGYPTLTLTPDHPSETVILVVPIADPANIPGPGSEPVKLNMTVVPVQEAGETATQPSQTTQQAAGPTGAGGGQTASSPAGASPGPGESRTGIPTKIIAVVIVIIAAAAAFILYYRK